MTMQPVGLIFPDTELWSTQRLRAALALRPEPVVTGVKVSASVPNPRSNRMVVVRRDGGAASGLFDNPRLAVRTWAMTEQDATDLARVVTAVMLALPNTDDHCVRVIQLTGPTPVPDESAQPLRYMLFELTMRSSS